MLPVNIWKWNLFFLFCRYGISSTVFPSQCIRFEIRVPVRWDGRLECYTLKMSISNAFQHTMWSIPMLVFYEKNIFDIIKQFKKILKIIVLFPTHGILPLTIYRDQRKPFSEIFRFQVVQMLIHFNTISQPIWDKNGTSGVHWRCVYMLELDRLQIEGDDQVVRLVCVWTGPRRCSSLSQYPSFVSYV